MSKLVDTNKAQKASRGHSNTSCTVSDPTVSSSESSHSISGQNFICQLCGFFLFKTSHMKPLSCTHEQAHVKWVALFIKQNKTKHNTELDPLESSALEVEKRDPTENGLSCWGNTASPCQCRAAAWCHRTQGCSCSAASGAATGQPCETGSEVAQAGPKVLPMQSWTLASAGGALLRGKNKSKATTP